MEGGSGGDDSMFFTPIRIRSYGRISKGKPYNLYSNILAQYWSGVHSSEGVRSEGSLWVTVTIQMRENCGVG